jgi:predicted ATPase/DNA-binding winged helix-turn-helix (wHTH) protein
MGVNRELIPDSGGGMLWPWSSKRGKEVFSGICIMDGRAVSFGPFRLVVAQRLLLEGEKPVRLGSRAFDILAALVERAGEVVGKKELLARAWPQTFVEDANLKIQISALRRALGDGQGGHRYVVTVPGWGYNFVAPVRREEHSRVPLAPTSAPPAVHNLPFAAIRMIGREDAVSAVASRLSRERLVTILGSGGIGKTTVALAVADRMIAEYEHGVWLVDLAPVGDPRLVPTAVATVLGLEVRGEDPLPGLVASLRDKRMLLLLDNCEHVIDAAASFAAAVLTGAPGVKILATSREPLGVAGERGYRLGPLGSPPRSPRLTAAEAAAFPAVQLFVERVTAIVDDFALTDGNAPLIGEICRRLDGLPLAIEFAAPRVEVLGVEGLAARLTDSLPLLGAGRRTAMPRHRTMRAVVDWSYGLLTEDERLFFRALGAFTGGFTVEAAAAVVMNAANQRLNAIDRLADLVAKSLVAADVGGTEPRFRLLDTTRAYVIEKLDKSGERERIARCHAEYYRNLFERAEAEAGARSTGEWLADYAPEIDNLRAALDWAFSPGGDGSIGVALTAAAVPLWVRLSLLQERGSRAKQALGALETGGTRDPREEMRLYAALGASTPDEREIGAGFTKVLDIAERLGDLEYQLRALHGLHFCQAVSGQYRAALQSAQKFRDLAKSESDPSPRALGERMMGAAKHFLGDQISAQRHLEPVLARYAAADHGRDVMARVGRERDRPHSSIYRFGTDLRVSARGWLARVLWLQGFADQAVRTAEMSIEEAQAIGHVTSLCYVLAFAACPISLWVGDLTGAAHYTGMLVDHSKEHGLAWLRMFASWFQRVVALKRGDLDTGSRPLRTDPNEIADPDVGFGFVAGLSEQAEALGHAGRIAEGLALLEAGIAQRETGWLTPELLRLKGDLLLLQSAPAGAEMAQDLFRQALDEARQQGALSWELRAATSLARLLRNQGRSADAIACLQPVYDRFTEGFGTADLIAAKQLLESTSSQPN